MKRCLILPAVLTAWTSVAPAQPAQPLTLAEAQRLTVQNNPQLSVAKFRAAAAGQVPAQFRSAQFPTVSGSFTGVGADSGSRLAAGGLNNPVVYSRLGSGLSVSQILLDFGRTSNLIGSARLHAAAMDQAAETARADIMLDASSAYFAVLKAENLLKVATDTVRARQLVSDQVTALADAKQRSTLDVSFANLNLADARLFESQALSNVKAAQAQLATAMGLPGQTSFQLAEEPMPSPLPDKVSDLIDTATQNRPELKDLRLEQSSAERLAKAEHSLYYPSVAAVGTAGFAPAGEPQVPNRYGAIGVNINIPIFNGGLFKARQTEAELKAKAASETVNDLQNRIIRDVRVAYLNAITAYDRIALTQQLLDNARSAMDLAQGRFENGLGSIVELSQAQLNLTSAEIATVGAKYDYQALRIAVDFQTGTLR